MKHAETTELFTVSGGIDRSPAAEGRLFDAACGYGASPEQAHDLVVSARGSTEKIRNVRALVQGAGGLNPGPEGRQAERMIEKAIEHGFRGSPDTLYAAFNQSFDFDELRAAIEEEQTRPERTSTDDGGPEDEVPIAESTPVRIAQAEKVHHIRSDTVKKPRLAAPEKNSDASPQEEKRAEFRPDPRRFAAKRLLHTARIQTWSPRVILAIEETLRPAAEEVPAAPTDSSTSRELPAAEVRLWAREGLSGGLNASGDSRYARDRKPVLGRDHGDARSASYSVMTEGSYLTTSEASDDGQTLVDVDTAVVRERAPAQISPEDLDAQEAARTETGSSADNEGGMGELSLVEQELLLARDGPKAHDGALELAPGQAIETGLMPVAEEFEHRPRLSRPPDTESGSELVPIDMPGTPPWTLANRLESTQNSMDERDTEFYRLTGDYAPDIDRDTGPDELVQPGSLVGPGADAGRRDGTDPVALQKNLTPDGGIGSEPHLGDSDHQRLAESGPQPTVNEDVRAVPGNSRTHALPSSLESRYEYETLEGAFDEPRLVSSRRLTGADAPPDDEQSSDRRLAGRYTTDNERHEYLLPR